MRQVASETPIGARDAYLGQNEMITYGTSLTKFRYIIGGQAIAGYQEVMMMNPKLSLTVLEGINWHTPIFGIIRETLTTGTLDMKVLDLASLNDFSRS